MKVWFWSKYFQLLVQLIQFLQEKNTVFFREFSLCLFPGLALSTVYIHHTGSSKGEKYSSKIAAPTEIELLPGEEKAYKTVLDRRINEVTIPLEKMR